MMRRIVVVLIWIASLGVSALAQAHKASDSYLSLKVEGEKISGQWDIALRDLDLVLELDRNADSVIDWGEVRSRQAEIAAYAMQNIDLKSGDGAASSACPVTIGDQLIDTHSDGAYVVLTLVATCPNAIKALTVNYRLLFEADAQHRGLLKLETTGKDSNSSPQVVSAVFPADHGTQTFTLTSGSTFAQLSTYIADGVKHIAIGIDHILFLVALLLPAVFTREGRQWVPVADVRTAVWSVLKLVTAFTIAHSITLSLASLDVVRLPSRLVESLIAASVLATALDNIWPFLPKKRWLVAFAFGLIHGFGFASVLADLNLPNSSLVLSLLGFNIGVEIGQLMLVAVVIPVAYLCRSSAAYPRFALRTGSVVIAAVSLGWLLERSLNLQLMPF